MYIEALSRREFEIYALALPRGPNFDPFFLRSAWKSENANSIGAVLENKDGSFEILVMRRQGDHRFAITEQGKAYSDADRATEDLKIAMRPEAAPEPLPPGQKRRPTLVPKTADGLGDTFKLLVTTPTHFPALIAIGETYLAMPRPDDNFVSEIRSSNFDSRLFELYLLATFREQGVLVTQDRPSPDFLIEREGHRCYVEAVTANPIERIGGFPRPAKAPERSEDRLLGPAAVRFAKTLRSKLQREYERLDHVQGKSFALAIADFHAPGSMTWSREALPSYLYGIHAHLADGPRAVGSVVTRLAGSDPIPAGLFRDPSMAHLSAVIFSNAATITKFNRMGFLAGWRPPGLKMIRYGHLFDRTPGALKSIPFKLDVLSDEYQAMWPGGEAWCQELEVYHNPLAIHPIGFELLPGATHWFEAEGEIRCSMIWEWTVISSVTQLLFGESGKR